MGIYGAYAKELMENRTIDFDMNEALMEIYSDILESYESEDSEEVVEEGANLDIRAIWKDAKKDSKAHIKKYKSFLKAEDYKSAAKELDYVSKNLKKARDEMKKVDADSVGSAILGFFAADLLVIVETIIPTSIQIAGVTITTASITKIMLKSGGIDPKLLADMIKGGGGLVPKGVAIGQVVTKVGKVATLISKIIIIVKDLKTLINEIKSDKEVTVKNFNLYRNRLLRYMDDSIKHIDKCKESLSNLEKEV